MKKHISAFLIFLMLCCCVSGCSGNANTQSNDSDKNKTSSSEQSEIPSSKTDTDSEIESIESSISIQNSGVSSKLLEEKEESSKIDLSKPITKEEALKLLPALEDQSKYFEDPDNSFSTDERGMDFILYARIKKNADKYMGQMYGQLYKFNNGDLLEIQSKGYMPNTVSSYIGTLPSIYKGSAWEFDVDDLEFLPIGYEPKDDETVNIYISDYAQELKVGDIIYDDSYGTRPEEKNLEFTFNGAKIIDHDKDVNKVYVVIEGTVKNLSKEDLSCELIMDGTADYDNGYTYDGFLTCYDGLGEYKMFFSSYIMPLETYTVKYLIECPKEVETNTSAPLKVVFKLIKDGTRYSYTIR